MVEHHGFRYNAGSSVNATPIAGTYGVTITGFSTTLNDTDTVIVSILIHPNPTAVVQSTLLMITTLYALEAARL